MNLWIAPDGSSFEVPAGMIHFDAIYEATGITHDDALASGWIRVTGGPRFIWGFEVYDARDRKTLAIIEDFLLTEDGKRAGIETHLPQMLYFEFGIQDLRPNRLSDIVRRELRHYGWVS